MLFQFRGQPLDKSVHSIGGHVAEDGRSAGINEPSHGRFTQSRAQTSAPVPRQDKQCVERAGNRSTQVIQCQRDGPHDSAFVLDDQRFIPGARSDVEGLRHTAAVGVEAAVY